MNGFRSTCTCLLHILCFEEESKVSEELRQIFGPSPGNNWKQDEIESVSESTENLRNLNPTFCFKLFHSEILFEQTLSYIEINRVLLKNNDDE